MRNEKLIQQILDNIDTFSEKDLMMTRFDCHSRGLHSIVMYNVLGKLTRMFIATPDHEMYKNMDSGFMLTLGIHDHLYDLTLTGIFGNILNLEYHHARKDYETNIKAYQFLSPINSSGSLTHIGEVYLEEGKVTRIDEKPLFIPKNSLHTVYVPEGEAAAWLVEEGEQTKVTTKLFTNSDISFGNGYVKPKTAGQVKDFILDIFKNY